MNTGYGETRRRPLFALAWGAGLALAAATIVLSLTLDVPVHDPDAWIPGYVRMPATVLAAILLDVVPRVLRRAGRPDGGWWRRVVAANRAVLRERWPASHWWFAINGVAAWYLGYAAFRNVKSMAPMAHTSEYDDALAAVDRFLFAGHDPAAVLHAWFGTDLAAHLFSAVYLVWIVLVPVSIAVALVWTRHPRAGEWYVTAVALDWALGAAVYVALPTVGPIYSDPATFAALPETYVSRLQDSMWADRVLVLGDPVGSGTLQTIAAFASLHVAIMLTICLVGELVRLPRWLRVSCWVFFGLTILATVYLGWHFAVDVVGGVAIGAASVWLAGIATGNRVGWRVRLRTEEAPASDARPEVLAPRSDSPDDLRATDSAGPPRG